MRILKIWNEEKTSNIDLTYKTTDIKGFGTEFTFNEIAHNIVNYDVSFPDITLKIYFGIGTNAYTEYKEFVDFVLLYQNLVLEYNPNGVVRYADIVAKKIPKTQKDRTQTMSTEVVFTRINPFYELVESTYDYQSYGITAVVPIVNLHLKDIDIDIKLYIDNPQSGEIVADYYTQLLKNSSNTVTYASLKFLTTDILAYPAYIISKSSTKEIKYFESGYSVESNGYDYISKETQSFMVVPNGTYNIVLNLPNIGSQSHIKINYKKWVAD